MTRALTHVLEPRLMFYAASGFSWGSTDVTYSYMPDGTQMLGGYASSLFATLQQTAPADVWQREIARALQTWAQYAPLNFHLVADDGTAQGTFGLIQGDPNFGDIRFGARPAPTNVLGVADFPTNGSTASGDIRLNSSRAYYIGSSPDLFSLVLHESGHALGLDHSTEGSVMYGAYSGVLNGLTADDIAGIRAIYGMRQQDAYDLAASNNTFAAASALTLSTAGSGFRADLTSQSDVDFYRIVAPSNFDGTLSLSVDARGLSLLAPKVLLYDAAGRLVASASADYGGVATLNLGGLIAGQSYTLVADGATADVFGMGAYRLNAMFGGASVDPVEDTQAPTVNVSAPGTVAGTAAWLTAAASDDVGVTRVDFFVDDVLVGSDASGDDGYGVAWDSTTVADGAHTFIAKAFDAAGNVGASSGVAFTVANVASNPLPPALLPDRFESNDAFETASNLGTANSISQAALNLHAATDVDCFAFSVSSKGTYRVSLSFASAAGNLDVYVYDAQQRLIAAGTSLGDNEAVALALVAGQRYYLKVVAPAGATNVYDLSLARISGKTRGSARLTSGDAYLLPPGRERALDQVVI